MNIKGFYLEYYKRYIILRKLLISYYILGLEEGARVIKLIVVSRLLRRPLFIIILLVQRLLLLALALEVLELLSPSNIIRSFILY